MYKLGLDFEESATNYAKILISEYHLPEEKKTIKNSSVGGIQKKKDFFIYLLLFIFIFRSFFFFFHSFFNLNIGQVGGIKYICNDILFKFAVDIENVYSGKYIFFVLNFFFLSEIFCLKRLRKCNESYWA